MCTVWRQKAKMSIYVNSSNNHIRLPRAQYTSISPKYPNSSISPPQMSQILNLQLSAKIKQQRQKLNTLKRETEVYTFQLSLLSFLNIKHSFLSTG